MRLGRTVADQLPGRTQRHRELEPSPRCIGMFLRELPEVCEEELVPRLDAIVIHCRQPAALAGFYAELLALPVAPADVAAIEAGTLGPDESVLRLIALGATRQWEDPKGRWAVLADPEGNLFCAMYPAT